VKNMSSMATNAAGEFTNQMESLQVAAGEIARGIELLNSQNREFASDLSAIASEMGKSLSRNEKNLKDADKEPSVY
ncbi:MAG: hypothetical protein JZU65_05000, partial [Chlorobium sp.]|nr:hypothetical protein [Chlorobium sp.]